MATRGWRRSRPIRRSCRRLTIWCSRCIWPACEPATADADRLSQGRAETWTTSCFRGFFRDMRFLEWPGPLLKLFLGKMTPDEVRAAAQAPGRDARHRPCAADFYLAAYLRRQTSRRRCAPPAAGGGRRLSGLGAGARLCTRRAETAGELRSDDRVTNAAARGGMIHGLCSGGIFYYLRCRWIDRLLRGVDLTTGCPRQILRP